jgi:hypothetical protein
MCGLMATAAGRSFHRFHLLVAVLSRCFVLLYCPCRRAAVAVFNAACRFAAESPRALRSACAAVTVTPLEFGAHSGNGVALCLRWWTVACKCARSCAWCTGAALVLLGLLTGLSSKRLLDRCCGYAALSACAADECRSFDC